MLRAGARRAAGQAEHQAGGQRVRGEADPRPVRGEDCDDAQAAGRAEAEAEGAEASTTEGAEASTTEGESKTAESDDKKTEGDKPAADKNKK